MDEVLELLNELDEKLDRLLALHETKEELERLYWLEIDDDK